ncbi:unnamed protein product [Brassica rapa subsp. trilocularis]
MKTEAPTSSPPRLLQASSVSSTSLHRSRMPSPILASLLFSEHFLSSILRDPDKILTSPSLVFTGDCSHRLCH